VVTDILQPTHLLFILVVALLVLGPKRLPEVARTLGNGLRDFRSAISGESQDDEASRPGHYALEDNENQYVTPHDSKGDMPIPRESVEESAGTQAEETPRGEARPAQPSGAESSGAESPSEEPAEEPPAQAPPDEPPESPPAEPSIDLPPADGAPADTSPRVSPPEPDRQN
jgi:TatA/E family protein of Tat protein translocase